jgi:hypothetical protein
MFQYWPDNIQARYLDDIEMSVYDDWLSMPNKMMERGAAINPLKTTDI